jgi:methionine-rich copper-binding protein CopC
MIRLAAALAGLTVAASFVLVEGAPSAFAHAEYESSTPAKNEVLQTPPARVDVFYAQEMSRQAGRYFLRVFNEQDVQVSEGDGTIDDDDRTHMFATLPADLAPGRYIVDWMNLSDEDGDEDAGKFCFYVAVQPTPEQQAECAAFEEAEGGATPTAGGATATAAPATSVPTEPAGTSPTATPEDTSEDEDDGGTSTGLIIGGVIAGVVALVIVGGAAAIWLRRTLE